MNFYNFKLLIKRILCYEKPLRVALMRYLSLRFKTFRPHYESILYESCLEAIKLGFNKVSVLELGVASGNGIISLEKYKKVIEKNFDYVGENFTEEAKKMKYGDKEERPIYGEATLEQTKELAEEEISVVPLPWAPTKKTN